MTNKLVDSFVKVAADATSLNKSAAMAKKAFMGSVMNFARANPALATSLGTGLATGLISKATGGDFLPAAAMGAGAGYVGHKTGILNIPGAGGGQPTTATSGSGAPAPVGGMTVSGPSGKTVPLPGARTATGNPMPSVTLSSM